MNTAVTVFKCIKGHFGQHICLGNTAGQQGLSHAHTVTQAALGTRLIFEKGDYKKNYLGKIISTKENGEECHKSWITAKTK